jgi:hypothetical protein
MPLVSRRCARTRDGSNDAPPLTYITALSAFHPNPCDSATPGYVI